MLLIRLWQFLNTFRDKSYEIKTEIISLLWRANEGHQCMAGKSSAHFNGNSRYQNLQLEERSLENVLAF